MEVHEHSIPQSNPLLADYLNEEVATDSFFHYLPYNQSSYEKRIEELSNYDFNRKELVPYLEGFNKKYDADEVTLKNIQRLHQSNSLVVIGGQQAGILTGPLYTINKIITIIQQARFLEDRFNQPVVPVFWIAGEDHDFAEINHTYTKKNGQIQKLSVAQKWPNRRSVSDVLIDKGACLKWLDQLFSQYGETANTKGLIENLKGCLDRSTTYVDFFARIVFTLFKNSGLILIDSGDKDLRKIEAPYFQKLIQQNSNIDLSLNRQQAMMAEKEYVKIIETEQDSAHLFYHMNGERILLHRVVSNGIVFFEGKQKECSFTKGELLDLVQSSPEDFSNNVVTRPLMQEFLFPTLSFIAGPGEIAYWAELKKVFEVFNRKMPPVFPRLVTTLVEGCVMRDIQMMNIPIEEILLKGVSEKKQEYLALLKDSGVEAEIIAMKESLHIHYENLSMAAIDIHASLSQVVTKNEAILNAQLDYLEQAFYKQNQQKHNVILQKYDRIQNLIKPNGFPQERMLNIFYFVNLYGYSIITRMLEETTSSVYSHKVLHI